MELAVAEVRQCRLNQCTEPQAHHQAHRGDKDTQSKHHAWGRHDNQEGCWHSPEGQGPKAFGSNICNAQSLQHFLASNNVIMYATQEVLDVTTHHTLGEEAARAVFFLGDREMAPGSSRVAPYKATSKGANKGGKGGKKGRKRLLGKSQSLPLQQ
jgi:hypothetical protein